MDSNSGSDEPELRQLARQVRDLEERVRALEQQSGGHPMAQLSSHEPVSAAATPSRGDAANFIPAFGKALLALAGAYLLRAMTEFRAIPLTAGVFAGIAYAVAWLVLAARTAAHGKEFTGAVYGLTSALILAPLLWEGTVRFQAISTWTAATVLVVFACFGLGVAWRRNLAAIAWIAIVTGILAAVALLMTTRDLAPFTVALLAMAAAVEASACFGHWLHERWIVALTADAAILLLTEVAARIGGAPDGYVQVSTAVAPALLLALAVIYLSSTTARVLWCRGTLSAFETGQIGLALLLSMDGIWRVSHGGAAAAAAIAAFAVACGSAFYALAFRFSRRTSGRTRNCYVYSTLGLLLVLAGTRMQFSGITLALVLSGWGLAGLGIERSTSRLFLRWHAAIYLLFCAVQAGLFAWGAARIFGSGFGWVPPPEAAWISAAAAFLGYALAWRSAAVLNPAWVQTVPMLAMAATGAWSLAALGAAGLTALCAGAFWTPFCPTFQISGMIALPVLMAWAGTTWERRELVWLVYPFFVLAAYKLVARDLPHADTVSLFASLFLYGGALILLPRILQKSKPGS